MDDMDMSSEENSVWVNQGQMSLDLFHSTHSSKVTPEPPKISNALPIVKSTLPWLLC